MQVPALGSHSSPRPLMRTQRRSGQSVGQTAVWALCMVSGLAPLSILASTRRSQQPRCHGPEGTREKPPKRLPDDALPLAFFPLYLLRLALTMRRFAIFD